MKLSIVVPCYNERNTIESIIDLINTSVAINKEVIVVDDCSTDGTREMLLGELEHKVDKVICHERNQGKGAALRTGIAAATGDVVVIQDADLEYDPKDFAKLIAPIIENKADVVYGSRFLGTEARYVDHYWHRLGNYLLTLFSNMLTNLNLSDMETCYKAFRRDVIQSVTIEENRFGFEPEITAKIAKKGCRIYEVGISYMARGNADGKKIGWGDAFATLICIVKYNLFR